MKLLLQISLLNELVSYMRSKKQDKQNIVFISDGWKTYVYSGYLKLRGVRVSQSIVSKEFKKRIPVTKNSLYIICSAENEKIYQRMEKNGIKSTKILAIPHL